MLLKVKTKLKAPVRVVFLFFSSLWEEHKERFIFPFAEKC